MTKGCYTYDLLTQARPDQKHTKRQQFVSNAATPPCTSKAWCILRVHFDKRVIHFDKRVLHLRAVDVGATIPKTHTNTAICQKFSEANTHIKTMVHPEGALSQMGAALTPC